MPMFGPREGGVPQGAPLDKSRRKIGFSRPLRRKRSVRSACRWAAIGAMIGG